MALGQSQGGSTVGRMNNLRQPVFSIQAAKQFCKKGQLLPGMGFVHSIGIGKMGVDALHLQVIHLHHGTDVRQGLAHVQAGAQAQPAHAGVDFDVGCDKSAGSPGSGIDCAGCIRTGQGDADA